MHRMTFERETMNSDFVWGVSTSSYQIEGAVFEGGRGEGIWDEFCRRPGTTKNGENGDVACDHYHRWPEDIELLKELGVKVYRFSISWPRIFPQGTGTPNEEGIRFYSNLMDALLEAGIEPWVNLYHWDLPLALQEKYEGWISPRIIDDFTAFADCCFDRFGDRVKTWMTMNEPWCASILGYAMGNHAPGIKSDTAPWQVAHHLLLAHGRAVECYRTNYQPAQGGCIGIANNCDWREPFSDSPEDIAAAEVATEYMLAWFADPVYFGDYPQSMKDRLGSKLPEFTDEEKELLKGSSDYFTCYARAVEEGSESWIGNSGIFGARDIELLNIPDLPANATGWVIKPDGLGKLLRWIDKRYGRPPVYVTENGTSVKADTVEEAVEDQKRIDYYRDYIAVVQKAADDGVDLRGYFAWTLLDNFEWTHGYDIRFGLVHTDFETGTRTPKNSYYFYRDLIAGR
jgi:beta-glucosidase